MSRIYRTMQGREVDLEAILSQNETVPAVGNANVNARGDLLGPGGKIIKTREELVQEYYDETPGVNIEPFATPVKNSQQDFKETKINFEETGATAGVSDSVSITEVAANTTQQEGRRKK